MKYLFNKNPLVIDVDLADAIGLNEAVVLQQINYWLERSTNLIDGKKWIYNSVTQWKKQFSFMSESTISRTIKKLESLNLIFVGKYNKDKRDQTKWYSINHEELESLMKNAISQNDECNQSDCSNAISQNDECNQSDCSNAISQNDEMQDTKLTKPLPEITTEITTDNNKHISSDDDVPTPKIKKEKPNYQAVLEVYQNTVIDGLPVPDVINAKRKALIDKLFKAIKNPSVESVEKYFITFMDQIKDKPFYFGGPNRNEWRVNFEYVLNVETLTKTREGAL